MEPVRVVVHGAMGRVGQEVTRALCQETETQMVGAVDVKASQDSLALPDGSGSVPLSSDLDSVLTSQKPDVLVDFSIAPAVMPTVRLATEKKVNLVIGATGLTTADLDEIESLVNSRGVGAVVAPNFALGAVLMIHLAKIAARYMDFAEITELHHHLKVDAPSGTALNTARAMAQARGKPFERPPGEGKAPPSRGEEVEGVSIHSVRLPGLMAHHEVLLGAPGQTLSIRHDTIGRECYMPGVIMAIKQVVKRQGLVRGLAALLGLE